MTINERFSELLKAKNISVKDAAILFNMSEGYVRKLMRTGESFGIDPVLTILNSMKTVNSAWLLTGEGKMFTQEDNTPVVSTEPEYTTYLLPLSAMGGNLTGFAEKGVLLDDCEMIISPIANADFAVTVYGDSMAPEYPSGSRILIKKIDPNVFIDWGKAYVLDTTNGVVVKEVRKSDNEGYLACFSINPDPKFAPFEVKMEEVFGIYKVMMCMSMK